MTDSSHTDIIGVGAGVDRDQFLEGYGYSLTAFGAWCELFSLSKLYKTVCDNGESGDSILEAIYEACNLVRKNPSIDVRGSDNVVMIDDAEMGSVCEREIKAIMTSMRTLFESHFDLSMSLGVLNDRNTELEAQNQDLMLQLTASETAFGKLWNVIGSVNAARYDANVERVARGLPDHAAEAEKRKAEKRNAGRHGTRLPKVIADPNAQ